MVGGYKDVTPAGLTAGEDAADIAAAAAAAVKELSAREGAPRTLTAVKAAAKQVVAGLNWRLTLEVAGGGAPVRTVAAVVYQPLGGAPLHVTSLE